MTNSTIKTVRTVNLGVFVQDELGTLHGRFSGLGVGSTSIISEEATSADGKTYLKLIADPLGAAYEVGAAFPKEKGGMNYYSAVLDSPIFQAPLNVALFPDKERSNIYNLVWKQTDTAEPKSRNCQGEGRRVMTNTAKLTPAELSQFTGSENWYRHGINRNVLFTDGAKYVADTGGAYWLLDEIAITQRYDKRVAAEEFQVWKLAVRPDRTATLVCDDGNDNIVYTQHIEFTDFPCDEITLWFANNVIYLPSEH
jgi:uncharacterized protein (DUF736 family)